MCELGSMRLGGPTDKVVGTVEEYGTYNHDGRLFGRKRWRIGMGWYGAAGESEATSV